MPWAQAGYLGLNLGALSCIEWIVVENGKSVASPVDRHRPGSQVTVAEPATAD